MGSTLLLNADCSPMEMAPLSVLSWRDGVRAYWNDSYYILKTYDDWKVNSPNLQFDVPSIVVSKVYRKPQEFAKLSRKNILIRDQYRCQYCGIVFHNHELTLDHVHPRSHGGKSTWENLVTACKPCNWTKSNKLNIQPMRTPRRPSYHEIYNQSKCYRITIPDPAWQEFLNWPEDLLDIKTTVN